MSIGTVHVAETVEDMADVSTALSTTAGADVWHKRLGHPAEQAARRLKNIPQTGVRFEGSLSPCETCKLNKSVQQDHPKIVDSTNLSERLQQVITYLSGPITPAAMGGYR
ncbi:unnamed protein product [Sphacelaria rigidula]